MKKQEQHGRVALNELIPITTQQDRTFGKDTKQNSTLHKSIARMLI